MDDLPDYADQEERTAYAEEQEAGAAAYSCLKKSSLSLSLRFRKAETRVSLQLRTDESHRAHVDSHDSVSRITSRKIMIRTYRENSSSCFFSCSPRVEEDEKTRVSLFRGGGERASRKKRPRARASFAVADLIDKNNNAGWRSVAL